MIGRLRERYNILPSGETVLVGHSIAPELKELHHTALNLAAVGGLILLVGLAAAGGWFRAPSSQLPASARRL